MDAQKKPEGAPILKEVWQQFATYDANAARHQATFNRLQVAILVLGIIAVLLALVQTQIFGVDAPAVDAPGYWWYQVLRGSIILAPILIAAFIAITNQFKSGNKWLMLRSGAESLKREIYRYRARAGIYSAEAAEDKTPEMQLADKLTQIRRQVMKTSVSEASLKPYEGPIPPVMFGAATSDDGLSILTSDQYRTIRLGDQLGYFQSRTDGLEKKLQTLKWLTIIIGGLGTLLAAVGFELWVALTTALAAACAAYLEYAQTEKTLVIYNQVATALQNIETWWATLTPEDQAMTSNHNLLIQQTEKALEDEHSGWVQNMTDALAELQKQHATLVKQVKADVAAVREQGATLAAEAAKAAEEETKTNPTP